MAISSSSSSSSSDNKVQNCSKQCLESFKTLQKNFDSEREKHNRAKLEIQGYELALESLESRILGHEKNEMAWGEKYEFQNYNLNQMNANDKNGLGYGTQMDEMSNKFETDSEISMCIFEVRSSDEEITPENDRFSKNGYKAIPPPITGNFLTPRADISFAGLDEYAIRNKIIESQTTELNTKTSETVGKTNDANTEKPKSVSESVVSNPKINRDRVIIEDWNSDDEEEEYEVQTVRPETQTVKTRDDKSGQNSKKQGIGFRKTYLPKDMAMRPRGLMLPIKRVQNMTTAGTRAVVNTGKGKLNTDLKRSRWVWRPKGNYLDHVSKDSGSFILKKVEAIQRSCYRIMQWWIVANLKRKFKKIIVSASEGEEPEDQGRIIQDIDDDPLVSLFRESMKEKARDIGGVAKVNGSKNINIGWVLRMRLNVDVDEINTGIEDVNTGSTKVDTCRTSISTSSIIHSPKKGQREGKAQMVEEDIQATHKTKEQIRQEEAGLEEAIRLQTQMDVEVAKHIHLDKMLAKRVQEEQELSEQQLKRKAEVQKAAQFYTEEDWDTIRAKLEANTEIKKFYAEQKAKAKRSKPMTQAQHREYMSTFIKNQSSWKLSQLKKLSFKELKTGFENLMKSVKSFVSMETEARVKRHGLQLEQETSKKQKIDIEDASITKGKDEVVKEEEIEVPVKKTRMRRKQKARKGINIDKTAQDEFNKEREAFVKDKVKDASSESEIGVDAIPTATKPPTIVNWKIISQSSQKAAYQIIRKDGSDKIYMSFGAILKDFSRDELIELYRLVIKKYGANRPEEVYDRVLWGDLKTMFDPPLSDDAIWSLPLQRKIINWRYYPTCAVHCLTLDASTIYMLADRKYPLSKDACQVMLKMKLLDGTMDEVCYQLLKMIEKQAGIRNCGAEMRLSIRSGKTEWKRAATTASSLDAEHDSGNINRTQSMATLNKSNP
ncbi:hypothetical protein Tco_0724196 [Tanacetum coccineum]